MLNRYFSHEGYFSQRKYALQWDKEHIYRRVASPVGVVETV